MQFQGKSKEEAVLKASQTLGHNNFTVEVIEDTTRGWIFKRGSVTINVEESNKEKEKEEIFLTTEEEKKLLEFLKTIIDKMGCEAILEIGFKHKNKIGINIISEDALLIGKKGQNLDSLQTLANVYLNTILSNESSIKVILDMQEYRDRREKQIVDFALKVAEKVKKTKKSQLLEPMNPFERRLVHMALNEKDYIYTESQGTGTYKKIRISYKYNNKK